MRLRSPFVVPLAAAIAAYASAVATAEVLTIEQAQALSKETGRPMLVMAGSKT